LDELKAYLLGRATRSEYWIWMVFILVGTTVLNVLVRNPTLTSTVSFVPWAIIAPRRLRDFGWSGWWCLSTVGSGFVVGVIFSIINAIGRAQTGGPFLANWVLLAACGVVSWSIIIYIGSRKGVVANASPEARADLIRTFE
jgi:uncharacterized membrane protein YhaH (DUF805 family)